MSRRHDRNKDLDPDARFLLANERTFLAWVRTALAVMIGGIALAQLGHNSQTEETIGMIVIVLGGFMALIGYLRFKDADKAIRRGDLPEVGREPAIQAVVIFVVACLIVITHLIGIW